MKKLSDDLKRELSGLAQRDAVEFLAMSDTATEAGADGAGTGCAARVGNRLNKPVTRCVALISDGRGMGAPLDYAIDTCSREDARIDLLLHGTVGSAQVSALENRIRAAGLDCRHIRLGNRPRDAVAEYFRNHPSLLFLVAMPDDKTARALAEEAIPGRGGRLPVPLVFIEERRGSRAGSRSLARG